MEITKTLLINAACLLADPAGRCCSAAPALLSKKNQMVGWCGGSGRSGDLLDRYFLL